MKIDIRFSRTAADGRVFIGWSPVEVTAHLVDADERAVPLFVTLHNGGAPNGGRVTFAGTRSDEGSDRIDLAFAPGESVKTFWVAGEFLRPSAEYGDAAIEASVMDHGTVGRQDLMVRVRKNAVKLSGAERDRFLAALGSLNAAGKGPYQSFRDAHVVDAYEEEHGYPGFLPWHRAYLLDLERSLQSIDETVTLPYWRFDEPAPALFAQDFFGMPSADVRNGDIIQFPAGHALEYWKTDTNDPIERRPRFDINGVSPRVISQADTIALGTKFADFRNMEAAPHGSAHVSFNGPVNYPPTAPKDPLFFLLHANVDRLWAFWQWLRRLRDPSDTNSYELTGPTRHPSNIGHKLDDTMWPWNGERNPPRPPFTPPRQAFPASSLTSRPGPTPKIRDMIDYQGVHEGEPMGFDYDDVPFELDPVATS